jgi:SET domain-containing protein
MSDNLTNQSVGCHDDDVSEEAQSAQQKDELSLVFPDIPRYYRIGKGPKGRGLFATHDVPARTLLHVAPCIKVEPEEYEEYMKYTTLEHYLFNTPSGFKLLALGDGSLFNHSRQPNVDYRVDGDRELIRYTSGHAPIQTGEELCISYGANLWFEDADGDNDQERESSDVEDQFLERLGLE